MKMTHKLLFRHTGPNHLFDFYVIRGFALALTHGRYGDRLFVGPLVFSLVRF